MDEQDLTAAESKSIYDQIKEYVLKKTGLKVSNLYITQVNDKRGLEKRENYNLPKLNDARQPKCPEEKEKAIEEVLIYLQMI